MNAATFNPESSVNPDDWYILRTFVHDGITYGRNERLPATLTGQDVAGLLRIGVLVKIRPDGSFERPSMPKPESPAAYLRHADSQVLRLVREHRPPQEDMLQIALLARQNRRGTLLVDALDAMAGAPLVPPRGQGVPMAGDLARLQADLRAAINAKEEAQRAHALLQQQHSFLQDEHDKLQTAHAELVEQHNKKSPN